MEYSSSPGGHASLIAPEQHCTAHSHCTQLASSHRGCPCPPRLHVRNRRSVDTTMQHVPTTPSGPPCRPAATSFAFFSRRPVAFQWKSLRLSPSRIAFLSPRRASRSEHDLRGPKSGRRRGRRRAGGKKGSLDALMVSLSLRHTAASRWTTA
jgi:hypothetical protein